ncbi:DoxX family protein [Chryseobacterium sp. T16E-39]|uniref:DoxX family membrane protein n=1 Tax=Chryseobacterium sp. T16E-39 TaxID=2015076 RepID=UPI000B5B1F85|nr:DoxX family membrane protein [Chryseobacterium sp. T16E-39]ASK32180.1 DoxX family protein [Chryseobacterium sp. T16E-39]
MKNSHGIPQLFLRIALGLGFIIPVMDRFGLIGAPDSGKVAWGDWSHFSAYTNVLMPFLNKTGADVVGMLATLAEIAIGIGLLIGFKTKIVALGAAIITFVFAVIMIFSLGIGAPFKYPVFVFTGAGLLLSSLHQFNWSIDNLLLPKGNNTAKNID